MVCGDTLTLYLGMNIDSENMIRLLFRMNAPFHRRNIRKLAIEITGFWRTNVRSNIVFFLSFNADSSSHCECEMCLEHRESG